MTDESLATSHGDALTIHITDGFGRSPITPAKRSQRETEASGTDKGPQSKRSNNKVKRTKRHLAPQVDSVKRLDNAQPKPWDGPSLRHLFSFASKTPANSSGACPEDPETSRMDYLTTSDNTDSKAGDTSSLRHLFSSAPKPPTNNPSTTKGAFRGFRFEQENVSPGRGAPARGEDVGASDRTHKRVEFFTRGTKQGLDMAKSNSSGRDTTRGFSDSGVIQREINHVEPYSLMEKDGHFESLVGLNPYPRDSQHTVHYDLYDEDAIVNAAKRFHRTVDIDEICEQFEAEGGIREMMKRDFRLKQQNNLRGRKLGSAPSDRLQDASG